MDIKKINYHITEKQLFDYIKCPISYDLRYNKKIEFEHPMSATAHLNSIGNFFMLNLMNGKVMTQEAVKRKWDRVCEANIDRINSNKCMEGISLLMKMYLWAKNIQLKIADINSPYTITFKNNNETYEINGEMSAIAAGKNDKMEILALDFSNRMPDQSLIDFSLKYSLDTHAFSQFYNESVGIHIHNVKNDKDFFTYRIADDIIRMKKTIINVCKSIENKMFYPRESVFCSNCEYKNLCKVWKG